MLCAPTQLSMRYTAAMNPAHSSETVGEHLMVDAADDVVSCMQPVCTLFVVCKLDLLYGQEYTHEGSNPVRRVVGVTCR